MTTRMNSVRQNHVIYSWVAYAAVFTAVHAYNRHERAYGHGVVDLLQALAPLLAALWGLRLARRNFQDGKLQRSAVGWLLLGIGCLLWGAGEVLATYYTSGLHVPVPTPGVVDAFYLSSYIATGCGVVIVFRSLPFGGRTGILLDSAAVTSGVAVASWYFVLSRLWSAPSESLAARVISTSYPVFDLFALFGAFALMNAPVRASKLKFAVAWSTAGLLLLASADSGYAYYQLAGQYHSALWTDFAWLGGWFCMAHAFAVQIDKAPAQPVAKPAETGAPHAESNRSVLRMLLPYISASLVSLALVCHDYVALGHLRISTIALTYIVIALVLIRQVVTLFENQQLTRDLESRLVENRRLTTRLRSFSDGLEQVVELRAQQLGALHQLTKAVHTTQQVDGVLGAAAKHTLAAMRGVTVAVWLRDAGAGSDAPPFCLSTLDCTTPSPELERFVKCFAPRSCDDAFVVEIPAPRRVELSETSGEHPNAGEMLCAPLRFRNEILGIIAVARNGSASWSTSEQGIAFDQSDHDLLESIGIEIATALHHARQFAAAVDAADHDPVTNLFNHRAIHQRLDEELSLAQAESRPLSIMMMDLNDFKLFNDTYGHPVGDQVLRLVARALTEENPDAICGRYGGDEFLVLGPRTTPAQAKDFAEQLRQRLISQGFQNPLAETGQTIPIAISFGLAMYPDDGADRHDLLTLADANLYKAKKSESGIGVTNTAQRANRRLKAESSFGILDAMVASIDNKDKYTRQHSEDVTKYALWLAQELRLSDDTMRIIRIGGLLHDVGKIGIPEEILRKPGHLTPEEYDVIKQHPNLGAMIVGAVPGMESIIDAVRYHHERWDGRGYPDKLAGTDIPMIGRIMAVADAFSAMTTNRAYRAGMDWQTALDEIQKNIGTQFDPLMARAFCNAVRWRLSINVTDPSADEPDVDTELPLAA